MNRVKDLQGKVETLRSKAQSSRQKVDEAKSSQAASTSQNKVLDGLTRLQTTGRISGFHVSRRYHDVGMIVMIIISRAD